MGCAARLFALHLGVTPPRIGGIDMHTQAQLEATAPGDHLASAVERRSEREVRMRFEEACVLLAPFYDPAKQWGKLPFNLLAMRALRERFDDLSSAELMVMLSGIRNLHEKRRTPAPFCRT
jgi:hypothetical protein